MKRSWKDWVCGGLMIGLTVAGLVALNVYARPFFVCCYHTGFDPDDR